MTTTISKNISEFYKYEPVDEFEEKNNNESNIKYKNLTKKYKETITIYPILNEKTNVLEYSLPFESFNKDMDYIHNIQILNNKKHLDWGLFYNQQELDCVPGNLFNMLQKIYNINNVNIIPFEVTTNNYLPIIEDFKWRIGGLSVRAVSNDPDYKFTSEDLVDLPITMDIFSLEVNESLQKEYVKSLEQNIDNLIYDSRLSSYVDRKYYKYRGKTIIGFYNFETLSTGKLNGYIKNIFNNIQENNLYSDEKKVKQIIVDAGIVKLSNINLYLNNNLIVDTEFINIVDNVYIINFKTSIDFRMAENKIITFKVNSESESESESDIKKIKYYTVTQRTLI